MKEPFTYWLILSNYTTNLRVVPLKQRLIFSAFNRFVYSNCNLDDIVRNGVNSIKDRIEEVESRIANEDKIYFNPSKTAQNGINFVTNQSIDELQRSDNDNIKDLFRLLYILG